MLTICTKTLKQVKGGKNEVSIDGESAKDGDAQYGAHALSGGLPYLQPLTGD